MLTIVPQKNLVELKKMFRVQKLYKFLEHVCICFSDAVLIKQ